MTSTEHPPRTESRYWTARRVLVTGCSGLLGSALCRALVEQGSEVVGLVRDAVPSSRLVAEGTIDAMVTVRGDIEDLAVLMRVLAEYEIEVVFHLAAQAIVGTANRDPISTFRTNIAGSWNVFEACRHTPSVGAVVVASSDKAYGDSDRLPYDESMPLQGRHPYDVSKSCTDLIAQTYHETYGLPVAITRCGNFFGGGDLNFNRIVPGTIRSVLENKRPIIRSDGTMVRDYIYVNDVVAAYLDLAEALIEPTVRGQAFNFSTERRLTVLELTELILGIMGRNDLEPVVLNQANNEIREQYLSAEKARTMLGWRPRYTIEDALRETAHWYRSFASTPTPASK